MDGNGDRDSFTQVAVTRDSSTLTGGRAGAFERPGAADGSGRCAVEAHGLVKRFGDLEAVGGVDFTVAAGEIFAFLGPNGAGKSTTIKMLCTLTRPTSGGAVVAGFDVLRRPKAVRQRIGMVFQEQTLDLQLTAEENLRFHAVLYRVPRDQVAARMTHVLELVGLAERSTDLVSTFSGGMARRLEIARGLLHTPEVLFLDEPTLGLDPQTRTLIWEDLRRLRAEEGVTVFFTTHYMEEAEYADRIAIIDGGAIVACDSPDALRATVGADTVTLETADDAAAAAALTAAGHHAVRGSAGITVTVDDGESAVVPLISEARVPVRTVRVHRPSLDDVFLYYTGREIREETADSHQFARRFAAMHRR